MLRVTTNNKHKAMEVISAQDLFGMDLDIEIISISSDKHFMNNIDAKVTVNGIEFILYMDSDYKNVDIKKLVTMPENMVEFIMVD